jgi:hypothetical protein
MTIRPRYRQPQARPCIARAALLAMLLQLALPFLGLGQLAARGIGDAPFVICTGAGLVWVNPDGTPVEDHEETHPSCPVCALGKLAASAVLPMAPVLTLPAALAMRLVPPGRDVSLALRTAPPLPARGPPLTS